MTSLKSKKIDTRIRMFSNSSLRANSVRAERKSSVGLNKSFDINFPPSFAPNNTLSQEFDLSNFEDFISDDEIKKESDETKVNVFIEFNPLSMSRVKTIPGEINRNGNIITSNISMKELGELMKEEGDDIFHIQLGQTISIPDPKVKMSVSKPNREFERLNNNSVNGGEGVIIGIIDVAGFDFSHPDFLDSNGETRFIRIWDQGGDNRKPPKGKKFNYGSELSQKVLNNAIKSAKEFDVPPYELEPQSQRYSGAHGTHVASIAAGNHGVCPNAKIAAVLIDIPDEDKDKRKSFYDSTCIADAVDYLLNLADEMKLPISINISLGTNGHAHDGSVSLCRWIDAKLKSPGRSVCVAAGNSGQEKSTTPEDMGYIMGRIHTSGKIQSSGLNNDIEWFVAGNQIVDVSENELEIWYSPQDRFTVSIKPPGEDWIGPIEPGQYIVDQKLKGLSTISVYNELYHPSNGCNYISIYLTPVQDNGSVVGIPSGVWRVRLHGKQVRNGNYNGWIERDNPRRYGDVIGGGTGWYFPSYFYQDSNVDNSSINTLACGNEVVGVANLDQENDKINISSSQGPTRDGRTKPDLAAPGTNILAANGFNHEDPWIEMTGTSMSSPYVCGVVGLMLEAEANLTAAQILGILKSTSQPLPGMGYEWDDSAGYGAIDVNACIQAAREINNNDNITVE